MEKFGRAFFLVHFSIFLCQKYIASILTSVVHFAYFSRKFFFFLTEYVSIIELSQCGGEALVRQEIGVFKRKFKYEIMLKWLLLLAQSRLP